MKKLLFILILCLMPAMAWGYTETFYVCNGGDGSLPETDACGTAWDDADFNNAAKWDSPTEDNDDGLIGLNDILYFKDDGGTIRAWLAVRASGTSGNPITLAAYSGDTPIISGADVISGNWAGPDGNGEYYDDSIDTEVKIVVVDGTVWTEGTAGSLGASEWDWTSDAGGTLYLGSDPSTLTVEAGQRDHCLTTNNNSYIEMSGITVQYANDKSLSFEFGSATYNTATNMVVGPTGADSVSFTTAGTGNTISSSTIYGGYTHGVFFYDTSGGNIAEYNEIYETSPGSSQKEAIKFDQGQTGDTARFNYFHDNYSRAIFIADSSNNKVYGNIIDSTALTVQYQGGIVVNSAGAPNEDDNLIYNNTIFVGDGVATDVVALQISDGDGNIVKNNIVSGNILALAKIESNATNTVFDYNQYYEDNATTTPYSYNGTDYNFANWKTNSSQDTNFDEADPLMRDPDNGDYTLQSSSPAIDSGVNLGASYDDCIRDVSVWPDDVHIRDQDDDGAWSIGAYCSEKGFARGITF